MGKIEHVLHINDDHYIYFYDNEDFVIAMYHSYNARLNEMSYNCRKYKNDIVGYLNSIGYKGFEYQNRYGQVISHNE